MREMQDAFEKNYNGVTLDDDSLPGTRYWSVVYGMLRPGQTLSWVPWTQVLSKAQERRILESRGTRAVPGLSDLGALIRLATDQPPALSESDLRGSPHKIEALFRVRRTTFALCQGCHLTAHEILDKRMMRQFLEDYSHDKSLRGPNLHELQQADRAILEQVYELRDVQGWKLDDALQEFEYVRGDVVSRLQPRPRPQIEYRTEYVNVPDTSGGGGGRASGGGAKGSDKGRGRGRGRGRGKGSDPKGSGGAKGRGRGAANGAGKRASPAMADWGDAWHRECTVSGQRKTFCMRWNTSDCTFPHCKFLHKCPVPKADGSPCLGNHRAIEHRAGGAPRT